MCACDGDFTCSRCAGTSADPNYLEDVAEMLNAAVRRCQAQRRALETLRAELDLPEHLAEIIGDALGETPEPFTAEDA